MCITLVVLPSPSSYLAGCLLLGTSCSLPHHFLLLLLLFSMDSTLESFATSSSCRSIPSFHPFRHLLPSVFRVPLDPLWNWLEYSHRTRPSNDVLVDPRVRPEWIAFVLLPSLLRWASERIRGTSSHPPTAYWPYSTFPCRNRIRFVFPSMDAVAVAAVVFVAFLYLVDVVVTKDDAESEVILSSLLLVLRDPWVLLVRLCLVVHDNDGDDDDDVHSLLPQRRNETTIWRTDSMDSWNDRMGSWNDRMDSWNVPDDVLSCWWLDPCVLSSSCPLLVPPFSFSSFSFSS
mmetsp:Transcript_6989/g.15980  ORF Transcript_6989/g.15980 Transcript_6989/m.15980 type:complete len:288 (+) Transcript_6989:18-881(+)